ncbi:hypothetical protein DEO72_LG5g1513 [Vigna unguiculata]|uniref:Uncharacterized protein n=1 Tax=Vigna unguiculata TaxID=3917 RepID=A0A4D6LYM8_VIGUN|nr:hypothetical protein DEO72_LG5g1513 [Vigna unguiculata]
MENTSSPICSSLHHLQRTSTTLSKKTLLENLHHRAVNEARAVHNSPGSMATVIHKLETSEFWNP